jgi:hypothetical protein
MALDPMMAAFESEMRDKARRRPRPAATRRAELIDNSSAPGAAELGRRIQAFWADVGVASPSRLSTRAARASRRFLPCAVT